MKHQLCRITSVVLVLTFAAGLADLEISQAAEFRVSPNGTSDGDGSSNRPWDLATALGHPPAVKPGDTIWLGGGTYQGSFTSRLRGEADRPIVVRQASGERAVLDAAGMGRSATTLAVHGAHTWFWGFEVTNSRSQRVTKTTGSHPADLERPGGVDVYEGAGHKLINLIVHDCAAGISAWRNATETEAYGNLVFNNGWDAPDRGHGHAFYWQNETGTKRVVDNVFFHQFSHGIHIYGSSRAFLNNFHIEGNIAFDNGVLSKTTGPTRNFLVGGGRVAENIKAIDNISYFSNRGGNIIGYGRGTAQTEIRGNYFLSPRGQALQLNAESADFSANILWGAVQGVDFEEHPNNTAIAINEILDDLRVVVRPNRYERGRAHIAVINGTGRDTVEVDVAPARLKHGERYEVRDVLDYFGAPAAAGVWNGGAIRLSLTGRQVAPPVGETPANASHTAPEFGVFILRKLD